MYLLESDDAPRQYWVFKKWGRIGVKQGGCKVEEYGTNKTKAMHEWNKNYFDKTANKFGHKREEFVVTPGKFSRLDIEHKALAAGAGDEPPHKKTKIGSESQPLGK